MHMRTDSALIESNNIAAMLSDRLSSPSKMRMGTHLAPRARCACAQTRLPEPDARAHRLSSLSKMHVRTDSALPNKMHMRTDSAARTRSPCAKARLQSKMHASEQTPAFPEQDDDRRIKTSASLSKMRRLEQTSAPHLSKIAACTQILRLLESKMRSAIQTRLPEQDAHAHRLGSPEQDARVHSLGSCPTIKEEADIEQFFEP
uniref:Uncharacterized protein n=1 Tax=Sphaerodactylus townsendi TaxID=933632 RepID=A0ACB8F865_9SAUR